MLLEHTTCCGQYSLQPQSVDVIVNDVVQLYIISHGRVFAYFPNVFGRFSELFGDDVPEFLG